MKKKQNHNLNLRLKNKSKKELFPIVLIIIFIPIFIILSNIDYIAFNEKIYSENSKDVYSYFKENKPLISDFTPEEKSHLQDVKNLLDLNKWILKALFLILLSSFFTLFFYFKKNIKENISISLIYSGIITDILIIFLALISINFNFAFTLFHKIFFPQGNWMFPINSLLILTFPIEFFINIAAKIAINSLIIANILILIGFLLDKIKKRNKK